MSLRTRLAALLRAWPGFGRLPFGRNRWPSFASGFTSKETPRG